MRVHVNKKAAFAMLDTLVDLHRRKAYPFNRPDALIPQKIIPPELREDQHVLACFYFYLCIYMRGGIESLQAFGALIRMWREHPELFEPVRAQMWSAERIQPVLRRFVGWDSKAASISWEANSIRLVKNWNGNPLNLLRGLRNYHEAVRRIRNKRTKREQREAGAGYEGFRGFQPKMVSMLLYFYDWEGWLEKRFLYPSPADFHNFRLGLGNRVIVVRKSHSERLTASERISAPWRAAVMAYLRSRKADPLEVSDALWLFSLVMCGNSPVTITKEPKPSAPLFEHHGVAEAWEHEQWVLHRGRKLLLQTCVACPLAATCEYAVPARPYYRKGLLILRKRPRLESGLTVPGEPRLQELEVEPDLVPLLPHIMPAAAE